MTEEEWHITEGTVMRIAEAWSVDPTTLHLLESSPHPGLLGRM